MPCVMLMYSLGIVQVAIAHNAQTVLPTSIMNAYTKWQMQIVQYLLYELHAACVSGAACEQCKQTMFSLYGTALQSLGHLICCAYQATQPS